MLIAVDIGNSRIKLGRFDGAGGCGVGSGPLPIVAPPLPEPTATLDLPLGEEGGGFDFSHLSGWCSTHVAGGTVWRVASVNRGTTELFTRAVADASKQARRDGRLRVLTYHDVPLVIDVEEPARVGIDRLLAAFGANRIRRRDRAAIVVDSGSAMTIDLVSAEGVFCGGAILPGMAMSARALAEQTDALPRVAVCDSHFATASSESSRPAVPGKSTAAAIEAGLFWGSVGAIHELVGQLSAGQAVPPDVFFTGGASPRIAELLAGSDNYTVHHVPHLVLAGIALLSLPEKKT